MQPRVWRVGRCGRGHEGGGGGLALRPSGLSNGSRLSCGRLARRRKGVGRSPCPVRGTTLPSFRAFSARQLQALVGQRLLLRSLPRSEEHTSELQSQSNLVCRLLLEKKKQTNQRLTREQCRARAASTMAV